MEELNPEKFVRIIYVDSSGKTGNDTLYFKRILGALMDNTDVERSTFVYGLCDVLRAIFIYNAERKDIFLFPVMK
ncbi:MAG: hypothetical protein M0Z77_11085 [Thermoplasmatales archaeon]|nr:hypothetical protein [Candidatus Thermoplasmatota archaeon]MDA8056172.1 hypothetical protein [Thermoplasmatales archaeon]